MSKGRERRRLFGYINHSRVSFRQADCLFSPLISGIWLRARNAADSVAWTVGRIHATWPRNYIRTANASHSGRLRKSCQHACDVPPENSRHGQRRGRPLDEGCSEKHNPAVSTGNGERGREDAVWDPSCRFTAWLIRSEHSRLQFRRVQIPDSRPDDAQLIIDVNWRDKWWKVVVYVQRSHTWEILIILISINIIIILYFLII